jgi:hypothetical protein
MTGSDSSPNTAGGRPEDTHRFVLLADYVMHLVEVHGRENTTDLWQCDRDELDRLHQDCHIRDTLRAAQTLDILLQQDPGVLLLSSDTREGMERLRESLVAIPCQQPGGPARSVPPLGSAR